MSEPAFAFCLLVLLMLFAPAVRAAEAGPPVQKLAISFDVERGLLRGTARIDLPPGPAAGIELGRLQVDRVTVNGQPAPAPSGEGALQVPAAEGPRQVTIGYRLQTGDRGENLISPAGISLTGFWHPLLGTETLFE
nr:hypothetical protein [Desulfobacteraceae bacterium]